MSASLVQTPPKYHPKIVTAMRNHEQNKDTIDEIMSFIPSPVQKCEYGSCIQLATKLLTNIAIVCHLDSVAFYEHEDLTLVYFSWLT